MKQTEESLKIKRNIQEAAQRRLQTKVDKIKLQMHIQEINDMARHARFVNNLTLSIGPQSTDCSPYYPLGR